MLKPRGIREWTMISLIAVVVAVTIILPVFVVRQINAETDIILQRIENQVKEDQESRVSVNVATIACIRHVDEVEEPSDVAFRVQLKICIDEALMIAQEDENDG